MSVQGFEGYLDVEDRDHKRVAPDNLKRLIGAILSHPVLFLAGIGLSVLGTAAALLEPWFFGFAIDTAIIPKDLGRLRWIGLAFLIAVIFRVIATILQGYFFELLGQKVTQDLRKRLYSRLQRLPMATFGSHPSGRLLTRVTNDVNAIGEMFSAGFVAMFGNVLLVAGILAWLMALDLKLSFFATGVLVPLVAISAYFSRRLQVSYREARGKLSALNSFLAENLLGMKVVHLFRRQKLHAQRFAEINQWYTDAQIGTVRVFAYFQPSITWFSGLAMALIIYYGGIGVHSGELSLGTLVAYFSYVMALFQPLREIADKWNVFLSGMASAERIFSILRWDTETEETSLPAARTAIAGHIRFEGVWFAYHPGQWVLKDFNLEILPGERIGIVGHTGAGKTTLINLLLRFHDPSRGRILLDGKDIREWDRRQLRAFFGIIQQEAFIFSGTLEDNLFFWSKPEPATMARVSLALGSMGYARWLSRSGLEAPIRERGSNLSMGEKQVISFIRALATDPQIWILDEATSNMDSGTEEMLQRQLDDGARGRTTLLIAHRLATVRAADRIIVINHGELVEQGRHEDLVRSHGLYSRLYEFQLMSQSR